MLALPLKFLKK